VVERIETNDNSAQELKKFFRLRIQSTQSMEDGSVPKDDFVRPSLERWGKALKLDQYSCAQVSEDELEPLIFETSLHKSWISASRVFRDSLELAVSI